MVPKKNILAIINPISGTHQKTDIPGIIRETLDASRYDTAIRFTEYAGHATQLAKEAVSSGVDCVLSVGGDGTCNEIARALVHSETALSIIPMGSGNGLARHLNIPMDVSGALNVVNEWNPVSLDYCKANEKFFFCTCGVGFDALVSSRFAEDKHRGGVTYVKKVIAEYLKYKTETYSIVSNDGEIRENAFLIACANASQYGNNAYIAPHASMQDGKIDVTIILPFTPFDVPPMAVQLFTKVLDKNSHIRTFETPSLKIIRETAGVMHLDGEPVEMDKEIEIRFIHQGLKVLTPRKQPKKKLMEPLHTVFGEIVDTIKAELNI